MSPNEQLAVNIVRWVASTTDVLPAAEALFLDWPDWGFIDEHKPMLSGGERALIELAYDCWTMGTGGLASAMGRIDRARQQVLVALITEAWT